jgi:hypothetical protein
LYDQLSVLSVQLSVCERLQTFVNGQLITRDFATGPLRWNIQWLRHMLVLKQPLVFSFVMQYAEPNQWLFFGLVSKAWAALYSVVQHEQPASAFARASAVDAKTTSYPAAAASLNRALYACECDAMLLTEKLLPLAERLPSLVAATS